MYVYMCYCFRASRLDAGDAGRETTSQFFCLSQSGLVGPRFVSFDNIDAWCKKRAGDDLRMGHKIQSILVKTFGDPKTSNTFSSWDGSNRAKRCES